MMALDCTSETQHRTLDTIDEFRVSHPMLSLAIEILTIDASAKKAFAPDG